MKRFILFLFTACLYINGSFAQHTEVHDATYNKYGKDGENKLAGWMDNVMNVKPEPEYRFPLSMTLHMTSYKKGKIKEENDISYFFNVTGNRLAFRGMGNSSSRKAEENMTMIYDYKANAMIMLNDKEKTGIAMNINAFMSGDAQKKMQQGNGTLTEKNPDLNCKNTGKKKTIHGYSCEEYVCINKEDNTRSEVWISNKIPFDLAQSASRSPFAAYFNIANGLGGMMMEAHFYDREQLVMMMEVTNVNTKANLNIRTADYTFGMR